METIEKPKTIKTMKTINAKKRELVDTLNGLFSVQELKGKKFSLLVSKNIAILKKSLKDLEDAGKPSDEFLELAAKVNVIANKNEEDAKEKIDNLEKENQELVDARRVQMENIQKLMEEDLEVELHMISEDILPNEVTAQQINKMLNIIDSE